MLQIWTEKRLKKVTAWLVLALLLAGQPATGEEAPEGPPPPKIKDVKVWYYPPGGARPVSLIWWEPPDKLHVDRRTRLSRKGKFRIRAELEGGFLKDGQVVNYVSIMFRDQNSQIWTLPDAQSLTRNKVKDVYWRPPTRFAAGNIDFQVGVWNDVLPSTSLMIEMTDRTDFFILGVLEYAEH